VTGNEVILSYTMPIIPDKLTLKKEEVLYMTHYGGGGVQYEMFQHLANRRFGIKRVKLFYKTY
jgi:hypothetical protein